MDIILLVANDFNTIYNFRKELVFELLKTYKVILLLPKDDRNEYFVDLGCIVTETKITRFGKNPFREVKLLFSYFKLVSRFKPRAVLSFTIKPNLYIGIVSRFKKFKFVPNVTGLGSNLQSEGLRSWLLFNLYKIALKKAYIVLFQNESNKTLFLNKRIVSNNWKLLPGSGINLLDFKYSPLTQFSPLKFITVSRVRKDKGFDELLKAITMLKEKNLNCEFHIVGWIEEEEYRDVIKDLNESGMIIYHGEKTQNEVANLIKESSCMIHPSHHEGMANVILEAAAIGRPTISSNIPGCKEIVVDNETGLTFEPLNPQSLVDSILVFCNLSIENIYRLSINARKHVEENFNRMKVIEIYKNVIEEIKV